MPPTTPPRRLALDEELAAALTAGFGDLPPAAIRAALHRAADQAADYLERVGELPVLARTRPGEVAAQLPLAPPAAGEALDTVLADVRTLIEPNLTHWNHPGNFAYFAISGSAAGILGELLTAAYNVNAMLWRSSPAATELEERMCDWVRQLLGLPPAFSGHINDTASTSTFLALAAARHGVGLDIRERGLAGRPELPTLVVYASELAHSSVDKAVLALGLGLANLRHIPTDDAWRMRPDLLAAAIAADRAAGRLPLAVVASTGTTSTTSVDPVGEIAAVARRERLWLHVDAAYGGAAAACPELRPLFAGWEEADSIVVNPHKWLFVPIDCSLLFLRDPQILRDGFSLLPEYLRSDVTGVTNLMDYGIQLGRRFRALKLWIVLRAFGADGIARRIRQHCALARAFAAEVAATPGWQLMAPVPLSTVCFRAVDQTLEPAAEDVWNERLMAATNAEGSVFLSHTRLSGRITLRLAIGNLRSDEGRVATAWRVLRTAAASTHPAAVEGP